MNCTLNSDRECLKVVDTFRTTNPEEPFFLTVMAIYIEARNNGARVKIGNGTWKNNNIVAMSEHKNITIGEKVLIGTFVEIYDSNSHGLEPERRHTTSP
jgi:acetyltransferase-like isoleucine patch superfamily enzyme